MPIKKCLDNAVARSPEEPPVPAGHIRLYRGVGNNLGPAGAAVAPKPTANEMRRARTKGEQTYMNTREAADEPDPYAAFRRMADSLPDDVNARFQAHGLVAGNPDANLLTLLEHGINPSRPFHSGHPRGDRTGVGTTRNVAPYLLLSDADATLKETGVKNVVLIGPALALR